METKRITENDLRQAEEVSKAVKALEERMIADIETNGRRNGGVE